MRTDEAKREYRRALYATRKAAQVCVECAAGLQEEDGLHCVECNERRTETRKRYRKTGGARLERKWQTKTRETRKAAGLCTQCPRVAVAGRVRCAEHIAYHRRYSKLWLRLKRAGAETVGVISHRTTSPAPFVEELPDYHVPIEVKLGRPRLRILRAMRHLDWERANEVLRVAGAPDHSGTTEYNNLSAVLGRLVGLGLVERRGAKNAFEYLITDAGRAEAAQRVAA